MKAHRANENRHIIPTRQTISPAKLGCECRLLTPKRAKCNRTEIVIFKLKKLRFPVLKRCQDLDSLFIPLYS